MDIINMKVSLMEVDEENFEEGEIIKVWWKSSRSIIK
jgi:hypothetical protein